MSLVPAAGWADFAFALSWVTTTKSSRFHPATPTRRTRLLTHDDRRFSGDESFHKTEPSAQDDAGIALGVVVEGRGKQNRSAAAGTHHL